MMPTAMPRCILMTCASSCPEMYAGSVRPSPGLPTRQTGSWPGLTNDIPAGIATWLPMPCRRFWPMTGLVTCGNCRMPWNEPFILAVARLLRHQTFICLHHSMMPYRHRLPFLRNLRRKLLRMNEPNACTISKKPGAASNRRRQPGHLLPPVPSLWHRAETDPPAISLSIKNLIYIKIYHWFLEKNKNNETK